MHEAPSARARARWLLTRRQLLAVVRLELGRNLLAPRGLWVFFLAFAPALITGGHSVLAMLHARSCTIEHDTNLLAWVFQLFYVRLALFFGCLGVFVRMFRAEIVEKTLHYYLIAPLRRELLVVGKYLAGCVGSAAVFSAGGATCFALMYLHHGDSAIAFLLDEHGLGHLGAYLGVTALACVGYSAVFVALSLLFKNPVLPAIVIFGWESLSGMLPAMLQVLSVTFYLKPLFPVELPVVGLSGLFTVVVEPVSPWLAAPGLLLFSCVVVAGSALRFRRSEIDTED